MSDLNGKVAIVTGGGRGLGRAHALALAERGAAVVVNDLGKEFSGEGSASDGPAQEVAEAINAAGGRAIANGADISDWDAVGGIVEAALKAFGRLDIVVNNAGIARFGTIDAVSRRDWEQTIAVNLTGAAALCHWAGAHWRRTGPEAGRRIVNTSSGVGLTPPPGNPMYVASKAGVAGLTIACALELAELGVRANSLAPVGRTRISEHVAGEMMKPPAEGFDLMAPENVAAIVAYLASPACRFTGRTFGIIGDSLTIFDGWSVAHDFDNGGKRWTVEGLQSALADLPLQQDGYTQGVPGRAPHQTPSKEALEALAAVEKA